MPVCSSESMLHTLWPRVKASQAKPVLPPMPQRWSVSRIETCRPSAAGGSPSVKPPAPPTPSGLIQSAPLAASSPGICHWGRFTTRRR